MRRRKSCVLRRQLCLLRLIYFLTSLRRLLLLLESLQTRKTPRFAFDVETFRRLELVLFVYRPSHKNRRLLLSTLETGDDDLVVAENPVGLVYRLRSPSLFDLRDVCRLRIVGDPSFVY